MSSLSWLRGSSDGAILDVYVQPKAGKSEFVGIHEDRLKIRLSAPPVEGEANKECIRFLSKSLGIPKSKIEIIHGHKSRNKTILFRDISPETLELSLATIVL